MTKLTQFDKYFIDTCTTINQKIMDNYPTAAVAGVFEWAETNEPELYKAEERTWSLIDPAFYVGRTEHRAPTLVKFEKTVLDWGRAVLKIYKKYSESREAIDS